MASTSSPLPPPDPSTLLRDSWRALWGRYDSPVYRAERKGWAYLGLWRGLRIGCLPLAALFILGTGALCTLPVWIDPSSWGNRPLDLLALALIFALIGCWFAIEMLRWAATLLATFLASTTVAAEVEGERMAILRATLVTNRQIVLSKFGGVISELRPILRVVSLGRIAVLLSIIGVGLIWMLASASTAISPATSPLPPVTGTPSLPLIPAIPPWTIFLGFIDLLLLLITPLLWIAVMMLEPFFSAGMFTAIGVLSSTLARTRASGLFNAAGIRVGYFILSYLASQVISTALSIFMMPLMAVAAVTPQMPQWLIDLTQDPALAVALVLFTMLASLLTSLLWLGGVTLVALKLAEDRVGKLPYGG